MATTIQIKRSSTASGVPLSTDLAVGELAVNLADKRLFTKQSDGTIIELSTNPTDLDAATLRIDGVEITASATELNKLDGFTGSTAELNILDGLTATTIELNTLDGITASTAELNKLDGYTGSTAELNILDGVTATTAEINTLDGITATTAELNYTDGVTSNIQTQLNSKASATASPTITLGGDLSGSATLTNLGNATLTATVADDSHNHIISNVDGLQTALDGKATSAQGALADSAVQPDDNVSFGTGSFSGAVDVTGTLTADGLTVDGDGTIQSNASSSVPTLTLKDTDTTVSVGQSLGRLSFSSADNSPDVAGERAYIKGLLEGGGTAYGLELGAMVSGGSPAKRLSVSGSGDVHFYEDTGTTAKFVWDASAEKLSVSSQIELSNVDGKIAWANGFISGGNSYGDMRHFGDRHRFYSEDGSKLAINIDLANNKTEFYTSGSERMRITSSGFVGINDTAPQTRLSVRTHYSYNNNANGAIKIGNYQGNDSDSYVQGYLENMNATRMIHGAKYYGGGNSLADSATTGATSVSLASDHIAFTTNTGLTGGSSFAPTERARIDSSGNLLVGTTSQAYGAGERVSINTIGNHGLGIKMSGSQKHALGLWNTDATGSLIKFAFGSTGGSAGSIGIDSSGLFIDGEVDHSGISFAGNNWLPRDGGALADNAVDLGVSSVRFDDIYATNGTIQTSDRNEKQDIETLSDAEQRVAQACKGLLRKFRWKDSVEEKGDDARIHFGIIAQDLQDAFTAEGLDAGRYAMFISSTWTDEETGEERTRLGVRYPELLAFIISAL